MSYHRPVMRMNRLLAWLFLPIFCLAAFSPMRAAEPVRFKQSAFVSGAAGQQGWEPWSHRPETAPRIFITEEHSLGEPGSLAIAADGKPTAHGGWHRPIQGIAPGRWYRLQASYRASEVPAENWQVVARIEWRGADNKRKDQPDYAAWASRQGDWTKLEGIFQAPESSVTAILQFHLLHAPRGTVWWDAIHFEEVAPPAARPVTVASVNLRPRNTGSKQASLDAFAETVRKQVPAGADLILLPEGISVVGTSLSYVQVSAPVPGSDTEFLAKLAREKKAYVAAGIYERDGDAVYNTSVLLDRQGNLVGKYRKVYLPREELEGGITPGDDYPVFETDFGRVGMMICYDVFFPDPARALAVQGADIILMPIWGGPERLAVARALENRVYLAASGYDHPTYVMDPNGEILSKASEQGSVALTTIDLNQRHREPWLGEMRTRRLREIRTDVPLPAPGLLGVVPGNLKP
ncbi:MAG: carbon-nitrogen hydrolase family protein [Bryobacterales bacterium]|nr:carbon-nitrogen hydrolase family protein [Bryobacterales bacterium]